MAKILAKFARRNNSDKLPRRNELVEMDLFDTDRNPWGDFGKGDIWKRHDYDVAVPFQLPWWHDSLHPLGSTPPGPLVTEHLVVERTSLALIFVGGTFVIVSGAGPPDNIIALALNIYDEASDDWAVGASAQSSTNSPSNSMLFSYGPDYAWAVLNPGTYRIEVGGYVTDVASNTGGYYAPIVNMLTCAATVALLPAGLAGLDLGWSGTGV